MTSSNDSVPPITLTLAARDVAYLVAAHAVARAIIGLQAGYASDNFASVNIEGLLMLHADDHYTAQESNTLMDRLRALLPLDTPITVIDGFPMTSSSTFVQ